MECIVSDMSAETASYRCKNLDVSTSSTRRNKSFRLMNGREYEIFSSSNSKQVAKTLIYDGDTQQVDFK